MPSILAHEVLGHSDQMQVADALKHFAQTNPHLQRLGERAYSAEAAGSGREPSPQRLPEEGTARVLEEIFKSPDLQQKLAEQHPGLAARIADTARAMIDRVAGTNLQKGRIVERQLKALEPLFEDRRQAVAGESLLDRAEPQLTAEAQQQTAQRRQAEAELMQQRQAAQRQAAMERDRRLIEQENQEVERRLAELRQRQQQEALYRQENADYLQRPNMRAAQPPQEAPQATPEPEATQETPTPPAFQEAEPAAETAPAPETKLPEPMQAPARDMAGEHAEGGRAPALKPGASGSDAAPNVPSEAPQGKHQYTMIPADWIGRDLYDFGNGLVLKRGQTATGQFKRKTRRFPTLFRNQLERIDGDAKTLIDAVRERTNEVWNVGGKNGRYVLAPKQLVKRVEAELEARGHDMAAEIAAARQVREANRAKWQRNRQDRERKIGGVGDELIRRFVTETGRYERGNGMEAADPKNQGTITEALKWAKEQPKDSEGYLLGYTYSKAKEDPRGTTYEWVRPSTLTDGTEIHIGKEKLIVEHDPDTGRVMLHDGVTMDVTDSDTAIPAREVKSGEAALPEVDDFLAGLETKPEANDFLAGLETKPEVETPSFPETPPTKKGLFGQAVFDRATGEQQPLFGTEPKGPALSREDAKIASQYKASETPKLPGYEGEAKFSVKRGEEDGNETGPHGPIFRNFRHNAQGAVDELMSRKTGEAIAALHHPAVGDIDLIWGKPGQKSGQGYGLSKIAARHPEVLGDLQGFIDSLQVRDRNANSVYLESPDGQAIVRLNWMNQPKRWLLTAYQNENPPRAGRTIDVSGNPDGSVGRQAPPPHGGSTQEIIGQPSPQVKKNPGGEAKFSIEPADQAGIPEDKKGSKAFIEAARKQWLAKRDG